MTMQPAAHFTFGSGEDALRCLVEGWSEPEPGFIWSQGRHSRLRLPCDQMKHAPGTAFDLEIGLSPFVCPPALRGQRIIVSVNGCAVGDEMLEVECTLGFSLPEAAIANHTVLDIALHCPDAASPQLLGRSADPRVLGVALHDILLLRGQAAPPGAARSLPPLAGAQDGVPAAVRALTGLDLPELAARFESLGYDCAFGLAQRQMGADQPGLLRFAALDPRALLAGLDQDFAGLGEAGTLSIFTGDEGEEAEYRLSDSHYGLTMHTHQTRAMTSPEALLPRAQNHLRRLRQKFMQDLQEGGKIFVYSHPNLHSMAHIRPILTLLRSHGPNTMLFVRSTGCDAPGTVRREDRDLLVGEIGAQSSGRDAMRLDLTAWASLCANAFALSRFMSPGGAA